MLNQLHAKMPRQKNVISLTKAKDYLVNWKSFIKTLYKGHSSAIPHGFFIPFTDMEELVKLQKEVTHVYREHKGKKRKVRIHIVGVRAYYILKEKLLVPVPNPVSVSKYPIDAVLVAVYQINRRRKGSKEEFKFHPHHPTYDLVIPVPSLKDKDVAGDSGDYSIYDITQPCPPLCDRSSSLH